MIHLLFLTIAKAVIEITKQQITMTTKRQWLKFQFLATGELFSIGCHVWAKVGFITAENLEYGERKTILPFRRVHSFRLIQTPKSELDKRASDMELPTEPPIPTPVRPPRLPAPTSISEFIRQREEENPGNQTVIPGDRTPSARGGSELTPSA